MSTFHGSAPGAPPVQPIPAAPGETQLTVQWPGTRALFGQVTLLLDGRPFFAGRLDQSFSARCTALLGEHTLTTSIDILGSGVQRCRSYRVALSAPQSVATLVYSRLWGNFKREITIR